MHTAQNLSVLFLKAKRLLFLFCNETTDYCSHCELLLFVWLFLEVYMNFSTPRISAPLANITRTISTWPPVAAKCKGVEATSLVAMLMEAPKCKRKHTTSRWPGDSGWMDGWMVFFASKMACFQWPAFFMGEAFLNLNVPRFLVDSLDSYRNFTVAKNGVILYRKTRMTR